jgi:hypothetical protein
MTNKGERELARFRYEAKRIQRFSFFFSIMTISALSIFLKIIGV